MLVKIVLLFLLVMAGLALVGRLVRPRRRQLPPPARPLAPPRCADCGEYIIGKSGCDCGKPRRRDED